MATIESGYSKFSLIGIPAEEFPELPKLTDATAIQLPAGVLKSMIPPDRVRRGGERRQAHPPGQPVPH